MKHYTIIIFVILQSCVSSNQFESKNDSDFEFYKPRQQVDLSGFEFRIEFLDNRDSVIIVNCSDSLLDKTSDYQGDAGFSYFKEYAVMMIEYSGALINAESSNVIEVTLDALTYNLRGFGGVYPHGFVQFSVKTSSFEKTYCAYIHDDSSESPYKLENHQTRKNAHLKFVATAARIAFEQFLLDLKME